MPDDVHFHRRHLPHIELPNAVYFVTFRLAGSLPSQSLEVLKEKCRLQKKRRVSFVDYDRALERAQSGIRWLADDRIAGMVAEALRFRDGQDYQLAAFSIMPNHVHLVVGTGRQDLFEPVGQIANLSNKPFSKIMQSLKRHTARRANEILQRSGAFWQDESYDHIVTNGAELERIVRYVVDNPVKAGLVKDWRNWRWTYTIFDLD